MRKQTNFDIRVFQISANPEQYGGMTHTDVSDFIRENYLELGWEVLSVQNVQIAANAVSVQVALVKYEDVEMEEAKRSPGRPRKEELAPA